MMYLLRKIVDCFAVGSSSGYLSHSKSSFLTVRCDCSLGFCQFRLQLFVGHRDGCGNGGCDVRYGGGGLLMDGLFRLYGLASSIGSECCFGGGGSLVVIGWRGNSFGCIMLSPRISSARVICLE